MRRLAKPLALAVFVVGMGAASTSLSGCHENLTVYDVCNAHRSSPQWVLINWKWAFGVYFCRAGLPGGSIDEYCVFPTGPDPHWPYERRECNWDSTATGVEDPGQL